MEEANVELIKTAPLTKYNDLSVISVDISHVDTEPTQTASVPLDQLGQSTIPVARMPPYIVSSIRIQPTTPKLAHIRLLHYRIDQVIDNENYHHG
jgi:hypothetical protein